MDELKLFCQRNMISWIPKKDGVVSCVKMIPKRDVGAKFYSLTVFPDNKWAVSVWTDRESRRKLRLYLDDSSKMNALEAARIAFVTFDGI